MTRHPQKVRRVAFANKKENIGLFCHFEFQVISPNVIVRRFCRSFDVKLLWHVHLKFLINDRFF